MKLAISLLAILSAICSTALAQEKRADQAVKVVKELCLTGSQFDMKVDAAGNLSFTKLTPGASGSFSVNVRNSKGAVAIVDDKIRQAADEDIRNCIKPHISRIIDAVLKDNPLEQKSQANPTTIEISASRFVRGERVAMATGIVAVYGTDVLMNAPPYQSGPNAAEFEIRPTAAGPYRFMARYASKDSRALTLTLNGRQVSSSALGAPTGCFEANCQVWMDQGELVLQEGLNIIRLYTSSVFPHITALKFMPAQ